MDDKQIKIAIGGMLHDIGKILYRYHDGRNHSDTGYEFLKEQGISDQEILDQVRFHHGRQLKNAQIPSDSLAYVAYWADNVAAGADRRSKEGAEQRGYDKFVPLASVFNILNGNNQQYAYNMEQVYDNGGIPYPQETPRGYSEETYGKIIEKLKEGLAQIELNEEYVNSLLGVLEANLSFVPSSTDVSQLMDISLFDHVKMTAAIGSCVYEYLKQQGTADYRQALLVRGTETYAENCFLMFSMDISGIQDFLYSVHSEGALKTLRAKSFYMEIMLEHIVDELLSRVGVSRANLIYSGGGHAYILLPNTSSVKETIAGFETELNDWYVAHFQTSLYVAMGYAECSANSLMNKPDGSYKTIFTEVSRTLSRKKSARYSAAQLRRLNSMGQGDNTRECKVCGRVDRLLEDDICVLCDGFRKLSSDVLRKAFITVLSVADPQKDSMLLPLDFYMVMETEGELKERLKSPARYVRSYSKNKMFTGYNLATRLWVGDYHEGDSFSELAENAQGIERLGVLRADVDNLGQAFVRGFEREDGSAQYVSISRTATFSRKLNMFFKLHMNHILANGQYSLIENTTEKKRRSALVVYSGGDDLFLVGAWNEIIEAALDIQRALEQYTQGTLTISAGIGLYPKKYPVKAMARETGELEEASKGLEGKNGITLFDPEAGKQTYHWDAFQTFVVGEKFSLIHEYFSLMPEKGMSAIYRLMTYIRSLEQNEDENKINLARLAYLLGRMEPDKKASPKIKELYRRFSASLYEWVSGEAKKEDRRQLMTAIYLYVYLNRTRRQGESDEQFN